MDPIRLRTATHRVIGAKPRRSSPQPGWLRAEALASRRIDPADLAELRIVHEPAEVVEIVLAAREQQRSRAPGP